MLDLQLESGKIIALQGDLATVSTLLISMAVKLQERSKVLYIDSAHTFNPGFVHAKYHKSPQISLNKIMISRPFSPEQLLTVIKKTGQAIRETRAKSVIISALDRLFYDQETDEKDRMFLFSQVLDELGIVAWRHNAVVLVGLSSRIEEPSSSGLKQALAERLDVCCKV